MARSPTPSPESLSWAVVTRAEALRAGVSPRRLRAVVRWHQFVLSPDEVRAASWAVPSLHAGDGPLHLPARVTTRARTWRDLAGTVSSEQLTVIGDHLVRRCASGRTRRRRPACDSLSHAPACPLPC